MVQRSRLFSLRRRPGRYSRWSAPRWCQEHRRTCRIRRYVAGHQDPTFGPVRCRDCATFLFGFEAHVYCTVRTGSSQAFASCYLSASTPQLRADKDTGVHFSNLSFFIAVIIRHVLFFFFFSYTSRLIGTFFLQSHQSQQSPQSQCVCLLVRSTLSAPLE